ncbi:MAG: helix-turn-helix domain-containing protein [Steroidobacteraceae bacterium]
MRRARRGQNMTQAALAAVVGVDLSTISTIERGEVTPSFATLWTVADILGSGLDELVGRRTPNATRPEIEGAALGSRSSATVPEGPTAEAFRLLRQEVRLAMETAQKAQVAAEEAKRLAEHRGRKSA